MSRDTRVPPGDRDKPEPPRNGNLAILTAKQAKALQLALSGANYDAIADACGYRHRSSAMRIVRSAIAKWAPVDPRDAEALRDLSLARLDRMLQAHWDQALAGDYKSTEMCLRIMRRQAVMMGLDAALKVDAEISGDLDSKIEDLVNRLNRKGSGTEEYGLP